MDVGSRVVHSKWEKTGIVLCIYQDKAWVLWDRAKEPQTEDISRLVLVDKKIS